MHIIIIRVDELLSKLKKALAHEVDDYLEARIKFLRHQVFQTILYYTFITVLISRINKKR